MAKKVPAGLTKPGVSKAQKKSAKGFGRTKADVKKAVRGFNADLSRYSGIRQG